ncbi:MAG: hypothetical protein V1787_00190 [Candidatus Micrarchaeota archaeon]
MQAAQAARKIFEREAIRATNPRMHYKKASDAFVKHTLEGFEIPQEKWRAVENAIAVRRFAALVNRWREEGDLNMAVESLPAIQDAAGKLITDSRRRAFTGAGSKLLEKRADTLLTLHLRYANRLRMNPPRIKDYTAALVRLSDARFRHALGRDAKAVARHIAQGHKELAALAKRKYGSDPSG